MGVIKKWHIRGCFFNFLFFYQIYIEKAFDTKIWKFLNQCIIYINIEYAFQHWMKSAFTVISSCVLNTDGATEFFQCLGC